MYSICVNMYIWKCVNGKLIWVSTAIIRAGIIYVNWNEIAIIDDLHYMIDNEMFQEVTKNSDNIVLHDSLKHKTT
jgi:hypothetical protein